MDVFTAIAEPTRRRLLDALRPGEAPVGRLAADLGLAQPAVSKHLRVLLEAGLVAVRSDAQRRLYRVRPESLRTALQWLEPYRAMWAAHLDDLERHLDHDLIDDLDENDENDDLDENDDGVED
ncbi:MAG TPA: metalloregulator ArsR/SmtB family transcription factor [Kineosporiaceae bacterium]|nr:metalloregulator ArsR/SmtB family transcription factor [Kineosporiaceae bacterium]